MHKLIFDTSFFTKNNTKDVYNVELIDELEGKVHVIGHLYLEGDAIREFPLENPIPVTR